MTIRALQAQSCPPAEIIISVNTSNNYEFVRSLIEFSSSINIVDASNNPNNASYARNLAAINSSSDYLLFMDDDTIIGKTTFIKDVFSHSSSFDFSCGATRYWAPPNWRETLIEIDPIQHTMVVLKDISIEPINLNRRNNKQKLSNFSFIGNFGIISRKFFEKSGGFDEDFQGWGYEDTDLMQELLFQGARFHLMTQQDVYCFHLSHYTDKSLVQQNIDRYEAKCTKRGVKYKINHLLGVFENDGFGLSRKL